MNTSELIELLEELGHTPSDEGDPLSALDHGLQCAYELAVDRPDDVELQIAGLVHDIGHEFGSDEEHGRIGAEKVRPVLGERIADLVDAHVVAKRYLVRSDPTYQSMLSPTSSRTLDLQGGPLSDEEADAFLALPHAADAVVLRRADESAKVPGRVVPTLDRWIPVMRGVTR